MIVLIFAIRVTLSARHKVTTAGNPSGTAATAREIARILRFPNAIKLEQFSKQRIELAEYRVGEKNPLRGLALADLYASLRVKVLVCAVARGKELFIPSGNFVIRQGDKIYITATPGELEQFFRKLGLFKSRAGSVMVV